VEAAKEAEAATTPRRRGRPKKHAVEAIKDAPRSIVTPTKDRILKSRKSVTFETHDDVDLGFKDLPDPDSANKTSTLKKGRNPSELSHGGTEEPGARPSGKGKKQVDSVGKTQEVEEEEEEDVDDEVCAVCSGLDSKKGNEIIFCDSCDFAVHLKCYDLPKIPRGDWFCRDCQPDQNGNILGMEVDDDVAIGEAFNDLPEIEGFEGHLRHMQRVLLDRLTGQKRVKLRGHDEELRKVHRVIEQTVLAGEGNSMLIIGARGCGKTTVCASSLRLMNGV
jgi:origin recognition complex subunit 4